MTVLVEFIRHELRQFLAPDPYRFRTACVIEHFEMAQSASEIVTGQPVSDPNKLVNWYHGAFCPNAAWRLKAMKDPEYMQKLANCKTVIDTYFVRNGIPIPEAPDCYSCKKAKTAVPSDDGADGLKEIAERYKERMERMQMYEAQKGI